MEEESEENETKEIAESLKEIDNHLNEIESFNKRNFRIDPSCIELYNDIYSRYDTDIVKAPY